MKLAGDPLEVQCGENAPYDCSLHNHDRLEKDQIGIRPIKGIAVT